MRAREIDDHNAWRLRYAKRGSDARGQETQFFIIDCAGTNCPSPDPVIWPIFGDFIDQYRWNVWKLEPKQQGGKPTKVPYQAKAPEKKALPNDLSTWTDLKTAYRAYILTRGFTGIGLCLKDSHLCAFDLDNVRDPETGHIYPWALELVRLCNSYAEITPSGTGLRIIGRGTGSEVNRKLKVEGAVTCEPYRNCRRYITVTGNHLEGTPFALNDIGQQIDGMSRTR